jgi:hypothetical protein
LADYAAVLVGLSPALGRDPRYEPLVDFVEMSALERTLNTSDLARERREIIERMADHSSTADLNELVQRTSDLRAGKLSTLAFYAALLEAGQRLQRRGAKLTLSGLTRYVSYLRRVEMIRLDRLLGAVESVHQRIVLDTGNDKATALDQMERELRLERLLWRQELSPDQYQSLNRKPPLNVPDFAHKLRQLLKREGLPLPDALPSMDWMSWRPRVSNYYELALARDRAFVNNALSAMASGRIHRAVLIAGGFHTPGMTALLRKKGIPYVVIQPSFNPDELRTTGREMEITQDLQSLIDAAVREPVQWVSGGRFASQVALASTMSAISRIFDRRDKAESSRRLKELKTWLETQASTAVGLRLVSAKEVRSEDKRWLVLSARSGGKPFFAVMNLNATHGDRIAVLDEAELSGKSVSLAGKIPGLLAPAGPMADLLQRALAEAKHLTTGWVTADTSGKTRLQDQAFADLSRALAGMAEQTTDFITQTKMVPTTVAGREGGRAVAGVGDAVRLAWMEVTGGLSTVLRAEVRRWMSWAKGSVGKFRVLTGSMTSGKPTSLSPVVSAAWFLTAMVGALFWTGKIGRAHV